MAERMSKQRLARLLFDVTVSLFVAGLTLIMLLSVRRRPDLIAIGLGMAAVVLVRRRWPVAVMAVVSALALIQIAVTAPGLDPLPYDGAVLIAMYSVVKYAGPLWPAIVSGAVAAVGVAIEVLRHPARSWWQLGVLYTGICATVWLAGYTVRVRRLYVAQLEERAATAERERDHLARLAMADERASIARELHDVVAHGLAVMIVQADGASYAIDQDPRAARAAIQQAAATGREALTDMRRLVGLLRGDRPDPGEPAGTAKPDRGADRRRLGAAALDCLVERTRSAGVDVAVTRTGTRFPLPDGVDLAVYRIVQEGLTNVLRHAGTRARVCLTLGYAPDAVNVELVDDGAGRAAPVPPAAGGHGLIGMRERVAVYGGGFSCGPYRSGWRVAATIPVPAVHTADAEVVR